MAGKHPQSFALKRAALLEHFQCLGGDCEDTCCQGWGMQLGPSQHELYKQKAPELLEAITTEGAERVMKRNDTTGYCIKFEADGMCGIHKKYGTEFLGDACHFYPRVTRNLRGTTHMTAALSCPEITRLSLFSKDDPFAISDSSTDRLPASLKTYGPEGVSGQDMMELIYRFVDMTKDASVTPERTLARILTITRSLHLQPESSWHLAFSTYAKIADNLLAAPQFMDGDGCHLVNVLVAVVSQTVKGNRARLEETIDTMEKALKIHIHRDTLLPETTSGDSTSAYTKLTQRWHNKAAKAMDPVLRRWLQSQLVMASFPYAGPGKTLDERRLLLAVRFATVRLALMSHMQADDSPPPQETIVRVVQSLARIFDHLADPTLSLLAYHEVGWTAEGRLRALIGDVDIRRNTHDQT